MMNQPIFTLTIITLFFGSLVLPVISDIVTSVTVAPVTVTQICPTLPPSCSSSNAQNPELACQFNYLDFVAIDCEFIPVSKVPVGSISGGAIYTHVPAQVAIVNYTGGVILHEYVRPDEPPELWRDGRRKNELLNNPNARNFTEMKKVVEDIIKDKIIVGYDIFNDLLRFEITHPLNKIRDFSRCKKFWHPTGNKNLRDIVREELGIEIGKEMIVDGQKMIVHDAAEDAQVTMAVFVRNRNLWEQMEPKKAPKRWLMLGKTTSNPCPIPSRIAIPTVRPRMRYIIEPPCVPSPKDYLAINCMFVQIRKPRKEILPVQVSLVDYDNKLVLNEYILQDITDLQTDLTGIDPETYAKQARNIAEVQALVIDATENKVLIAYTLKSLFKLLGIADYPSIMLRDASRFPRSDPSKLPSLQQVAELELNNMDLTENGKPSSPKRACAVMSLYQKYEGSGYAMAPTPGAPKSTSVVFSQSGAQTTPSSTETLLTQKHSTQIIPSSTITILPQKHSTQIIPSSTITILTQFEAPTHSTQFILSSTKTVLSQITSECSCTDTLRSAETVSTKSKGARCCCCIL